MPYLANLGLLDVIAAAVDIAVVSYVLYRLFVLIRGTRAVQLLKGVIVLLAVSTLSRWLRLYTVNWLLAQAQVALIVALPVVFQPELRRALEQLGRGRLFRSPPPVLGEAEFQRLVGEIIKAVQVLTRNRIGALIVLERETRLGEVLDTGTKLDGLLSSEFLVNIFIPKTPLHDGAVIVRGNRVLAAGCVLPLTENPDLSKELGTRHRAAIGITEQSDALALTVSEETGVISLANAGKLIRHLDERTLQEMLTALWRLRPGPLQPGGRMSG